MDERFVFTSQPRARSFCDEPSMKLGDCDRCSGPTAVTGAVKAGAVMIASNLNFRGDQPKLMARYLGKKKTATN
ncbi:hypothetical protein ACOSQ3_028432 [Xanthoceras sorbifolium]